MICAASQTPSQCHREAADSHFVSPKPAVVLIEATIVQVRLKDDHKDSGVNLAMLIEPAKPPAVAGNRGVRHAAAEATSFNGSTPACKFVELAKGMQLGWAHGDTTEFIHALQNFGEVTVLAAPRLLVLDKQRAEIHLGDRLGYLTRTENQTSTTETVRFINIGTQLRVRPFVSSKDGNIRLEVHVEHSTGHLDEHGVPQTTTCQITSNVVIPDGMTAAWTGPTCTEVAQSRTDMRLMSYLPYIGGLFYNVENAATKNQLLVFLTPHVWR